MINYTLTLENTLANLVKFIYFIYFYDLSILHVYIVYNILEFYILMYLKWSDLCYFS